MKLDELYIKAINNEQLSKSELMYLYDTAPTSELAMVADEIRKRKHPDGKVTWIIDRNVNITNVCVGGCLFCNFHKKMNSRDGFITSLEEYRPKIDELFALGGEQLLLQGGMHPNLKIEFYEQLFMALKKEYPRLKLHALGPPEIVHIARLSRLTTKAVLERLIKAGLDSLPGAGAEILSDRVRKQISPGKCKVSEWLKVMEEAHQLGLITSATMMMGHIETREERINHLIAIREVQNRKPEGSVGFISFIPWPYQAHNTVLQKQGVFCNLTEHDYIRFIAISRIALNNIDNIQPSWLTVGNAVGLMCLRSGANDYGSIMIEEHVVSLAGAPYRMNAEQIQEAIRQAGFEPQRRNQKYEYII